MTQFSSAVRNLMKWSKKPKWEGPFDDLYALHGGVLLNDPDLPLDEEQMDELLDGLTSSNIFGAALEDLATRHLEPDNRNMIDEMLKHPLMRLDQGSKEYLKAMRDSVPRSMK